MPDETRHESADLEDYTSPGTRTRGMRTWTGSSSMTARTPGQAGWEPRMREPSRTARPTWSHTTPESTAGRRARGGGGGGGRGGSPPTQRADKEVDNTRSGH